MTAEFERQPIYVAESVSGEDLRKLLQSQEFRLHALGAIAITERTKNEAGFVVFKVFGQDRLVYSHVTEGDDHSWPMDYDSTVRDGLPANYPLLYLHIHPGTPTPTHWIQNGGTDHRPTLQGLKGDIEIDTKHPFRTFGMAIGVTSESERDGYPATIWTNDFSLAVIDPKVRPVYSLKERLNQHLGKHALLDEGMSQALFAERSYAKWDQSLLALWFDGSFRRISSLTSTENLKRKHFEKFAFKSQVGIFN